jgi:Ser-Thr-rich glycosyl-phosphatidyl-inositol-anchored membrane family protein/gametolysin peptidase M11
MRGLGTRREPRRARWGTLALAAALLGVAVGGALADDQPVDTNYSGTYIEVTPGTSGALRHFLKVGDQYLPLKFHGATHLKPGQRAYIRGHRSDGDIDVSAEAAAAPAPSATATAPLAGVAGSPTMDKVLVLLVQWTAPDAVTPTTAADEVFNRSNLWYQDASFGRVGLGGTVSNWLRIATPSNCDNVYQIKTLADNAATASGIDRSAYSREMIYFPWDRRCTWGGQAEITGTNVWINGEMDDRIVVHELGHNYGLRHAHSYKCTSGGATVSVGGTCTTDEYGDPYDAMGDGFKGVGHFNGYQKNLLGWLNDGRKTTVTTSGTYTIQNYEDPASGVSVLEIPAASRPYWVEFRQPVGLDSWMSSWPGGTNGVLVHTPKSNDGTWLLDMTPSTSGVFTDAALAPGKSFMDPAGGFKLTTVSISSTSATVSVELGSSVTTTTGATSTTTTTRPSSTTTTSRPTTTTTTRPPTTTTSTTRPPTTTSTSTPSGTRPIFVLSPNGGEQWARGQLHTIKWSDNGGPATAVVYLVRDGKTIATLGSAASGANRSNSFNWTPATNLASGSGYTIQVVVKGVSPVPSDTSDGPFTLV